MREAELPTIITEMPQVVGCDGEGKPGALDDAAHDAVETVRDDHHVEMRGPAGPDERNETWIDVDAGDELIELVLARAHQIDLPRHAFARADELGFPLFLDGTPARFGEALEQAIRGVLDRDGAIEIEQNLSRHP